jgi:hypothetical protein
MMLWRFHRLIERRSDDSIAPGSATTTHGELPSPRLKTCLANKNLAWFGEARFYVMAVMNLILGLDPTCLVNGSASIALYSGYW